MKRTSPKSSRASALLPALTAVFVCILPLILAEVPSWWGQRGVVKKDGTGQPVAPSDFAAANQGQLKLFAIAAYEEFAAKIDPELGGIGDNRAPAPGNPGDKGSPGWRLRHLVSQWVEIEPSSGKVLHANVDSQGHPLGTYSTTGAGPRKLTSSASAAKDFAAVNLGQIKAVAAPFYDRLWELYWNYNSATPATSQIDPAWAKPWTGLPEDANDHAMATLGQLKRVFAINLDSDGDGDGLTNLRELLENKNRSSSERSKWTDLGNAYSTGGQLTDGQQYDLGLDPTDPVNGLPPDPPTGLHIVFRDADLHPDDPDLRMIAVAWDPPSQTGMATDISDTYAGNSAGWHTASLSQSHLPSQDFLVEHSKRVYEYRVTFTGRNRLTASADIAYELPVIRGMMRRQVVTGFSFRGVLLYPGAFTGVPRKYRNFSHTWNYDEKLRWTDPLGKVTTHTLHDDGSYTRNFYPTTHSYHAHTVRNESDTWSGPEADDFSEDIRDRDYTINLTEPVPAAPSSLSSSEFTDVDTLTYEEGVRRLDDEFSLSLGFGLQPFPTADGSGNPVLPVPFGAFCATDSGHIYTDPANSGEKKHEDWSSDAVLDASADGQFLHWTGDYTISTSTDGTTDTGGGVRNYGALPFGLYSIPPLRPGDFDSSGIIGPEDRYESAMEVPPYGQNPPQGTTPTVSVNEDEGASSWTWTRTYGTKPTNGGASPPQDSYGPYWTETVTFSGEITTASLVDAALSALAPMSTIDWTIPGQQPPSRFCNHFSVSSLGLSDYLTQIDSWLEWDYSNSYTPTATANSLVGAGWPQNGYVTVTPSLAELVGQYSLSAEEDSGTLLSSEYKFRIYPPAESCEIQWLETFTPDETGSNPQYKIRSCTVTPGQQPSETPLQTVDRTEAWNVQAPAPSAAAGGVQSQASATRRPGAVLIGDFKAGIITDINNDGQLNELDAVLARLPYSSGATEPIRESGAEFMFYNDEFQTEPGTSKT